MDPAPRKGRAAAVPVAHMPKREMGCSASRAGTQLHSRPRGRVNRPKESGHAERVRLLPKRLRSLRVYVTAIARSNGVPFRQILSASGLMLKLERMKALRMARMLGMSYPQIAEYFGITWTTVRHACMKVAVWSPVVARIKAKCPLCPRMIVNDMVPIHMRRHHRTNCVPNGWTLLKENV